MTLRVEGVVDGGVEAEQPLRGTGRLEPLHLALSSPHSLMRVFAPLLVPTTQAKSPERRAVGRNLSVTATRGAKRCLQSSLRISLTAARLSRRDWTRMSRLSPPERRPRFVHRSCFARLISASLMSGL